MATEVGWWLAALAALPGSVIGAYAAGERGRRLYRVAAACACLLVACAALPLALRLGGAPAGFRFPALASVLVPFAAVLWLITVVVTPSGRRDESGFARSAAACLLQMGAFLTTHPAALVAATAANAALFVTANREPDYGGARRLALAYLTPATVCLAAGAAVLAWPGGAGPLVEQLGAAAVLGGVMVHGGIFPFHAWVPEMIDRGRLGPAVRFNAPQVGTYVALVLAVPHASPLLLRCVAGLALVTAAHGALMALYQTDARRACGYLFVSQSALVVAGLDIQSREALVGAILLWVCSGIALAALSRAVLALEVRRGRLRLDVYHGGYEAMPQLAVCFLVFGLSVADFPGTLGFVGGEMLVGAAMEAFPALGLFAIVATALNGLAVMRLYFSLFCGKRAAGAPLRLKREEALGFAAAALVLVGFGVAPRGLTRVLFEAGAGMLR
ncbi:MAG: hypothetical protein HY553_06930 [Elusimicrobia bacterium]|nr:hypothetical protein [Elusimicrobiota bacterium]